MKKFILFLCFCTLSFVTFSQTLTSSPYSRYALGDLQFAGFIRNSALGQTGQAHRTTQFINPTNSASYSNLKMTAFESGLTYNTGNYTNAITKQKFNTGSLDYLSLAFPISVKHSVGAAFGLAPFSTSEYNFKDSNRTPAIPYRIYNNGSGGLSKLFFGVGADLFKHISLGLQGNYLFGQNSSNINYQMSFDSNYLGVKTSRNTQINGLLADASIQLHFNLNDTVWEELKGSPDRKFHVKHYNFVSGGTYNFGSNLRGNETYAAYRSNGSYIDTIAYKKDFKGNIYIPSGWIAGVMFQEYDHWMITFDLAKRYWSKYASFNNNDKLVDETRYSLGFSFTPDITPSNNFSKKEGRTLRNYMKVVEYRMGLRYVNTNLNINATQINEYAGSFGIGFPIKKTSRTEIARINFSAEYISRGTTKNELVREDFFRFMFGVTFNDTWFTVRKIY